ncbi:S8 family serine peptidase [Actinokineospora bangkokensis]|uniref:Serine protease n=1 Tax=Actinokineospora bangkokensis TaxID=1193682 RepID=A0A1Q9LMF5_9PSEU|nr:S8 family serine peptidase [Actinokineospora bangkokensis]OLR93201.1 serine protease [Actinokineospora bangkokensis]
MKSLPPLVTLVALAAALVTAPQAAAAPAADFVPARHPVPGSFVVTLKPLATASAVQSQATSLAAKYGGTASAVLTASMQGFIAKDLTDGEARALAADPFVKRVYQDGTARAADVQTGATWGLDRVDQADLPLDSRYSYPSGAAGNVTVYVTDTGVKTTQAEFEDRATVGADFIGDGQNGSDCTGHGTHVAGTIGSKTWGVAKKAKLVSVRMLGTNCTQNGPDSAGVQAVEWVTRNAVKPAVVNASWTFDNADIGDDAIAGLLRSGVQFVAASGNSSADACATGPANIADVITVNATSRNDARASFSNYGTCSDLFAPGDGITSVGLSGTGGVTMSGTSMAAPHVTGTAALYLSANTGAGPQQVRDALVGGASSGKVTNPGSGSPNKLLNTAFATGSPTPGCDGGSTTADVAIPDAGTAVTSDIPLSGCTGNATATTKVQVDIAHTYTADLRVELVGPSGRAFALHQPGGIGAATGIHQTFTVDASAETRAGTWRLRATDVYRFDTGVIDAWSLTF